MLPNVDVCIYHPIEELAKLVQDQSIYLQLPHKTKQRLHYEMAQHVITY